MSFYLETDSQYQGTISSQYSTNSSFGFKANAAVETEATAVELIRSWNLTQYMEIYNILPVGSAISTGQLLKYLTNSILNFPPNIKSQTPTHHKQ